MKIIQFVFMFFLNAKLNGKVCLMANIRGKNFKKFSLTANFR